MRSINLLPCISCHVLLLASLVVSTGCALPFGASADPDALAASPPPSIVVEMNPLVGKPRQTTIILEEGMTVQTALEKSKASRRYANMELVLVRQSDQNGGAPHRMGARWNPQKRQVSIDTDYSLSPGDVLIVNQQAAESLGEKMFNSVLGPIGG
ncbi:MAG: hypothetical protein U0795_10390 [Pirellulales bacterium]